MVALTAMGAAQLKGLKNTQRFPQIMRAPILDGFTDSEKYEIINEARLLFFREAGDFLHQDVVPDAMYIVAQGQAEVVFITDRGARSPVLLANVGMTLGVTETIGDLPCAASCRASAGSCLLMLEKSTVHRLIRDLRFLRNIARNMHEVMIRYNNFRAAEKDLPVSQRVAHYLLELRSSDNSIRHSQAFLGEAVGCSRQTINKILGRMRSSGVVTIEKGVIHIEDPDALKHWADHDEG
ncbi:hypothetical protein BVC71_10795 [Marivivens niveibacter]|uniref:Crp/Fnr family transcriptional regulator n=1 Tax=Marivivens niveibacter TaxID=1930667 RepID=A0A251WZ17_9RHOB|nr:Crp/Fnr family transcriptional regulator [Marivivens niveibacter]OUD09183.1 hypothetical protein BVC71_10795 [Marivivens niveibacter]